MKKQSDKQEKIIYCIECNEDVRAVLVSGRDVYPSREDLYALLFWKCPHCGNFVGTHKKTGIELGCIPNKKMKIVRRQIHAMIDPIWENKIMSRIEVYSYISKAIGHTYHTAEIRTLKEAQEIIDIVIGLKKKVKY